MRRIVIVVVLLVNAIGFSQDNNFVVEDNLMVWRKVYEDTRHFSALKNNLRLNFLTDSTGTISKTNFAERNLEELTADFRIESKEGKYRVSVFNIRFFEQNIHRREPVREYAIESDFLKNNGEIKKAVWGYNATALLNPHLLELFTIKNNAPADW